MIQAARDCLGTPFHHQGRRPKVGLDCIGLIVIACAAIGLPVRDKLDYGRRPDGQALIAALQAHGAERVDDIDPADVLVFRYDQQPQHVALATEEGRMIHSFAPAGRVVETDLGAYWRRRLVGIYRFNLSLKDQA